MTLSMPDGDSDVLLTNYVGNGGSKVRECEFEEQDSGREVWLADSGATHHATSNMDQIFDFKPAPKGKDRMIVGNGNTMKVRGVGNLNLRLHMKGKNGEEKSFTVLLQNVNVMDDMKFNLFSLHQVQGKHCLLYTSPSPRDKRQSRMPSSA